MRWRSLLLRRLSCLLAFHCIRRLSSCWSCCQALAHLPLQLLVGHVAYAALLQAALLLHHVSWKAVG